MSRSIYKTWVPDRGETEADAVELAAIDAEDAAHITCRKDFNDHSGDGRTIIVVAGCLTCMPFEIIVKSPDGKESLFNGCHKVEVNHAVKRISK